MTTEAPKKSIPVFEGVFTWPSDSPRLIGTRCTSCNSYYFPKKLGCNNPNCKDKKIEEVLLSTEGTLWSYTVMRYPPVPPFKADKKPPYPLGIVELKEGLRVLGLLTDIEPQDLKIGIKMRLVIEPLFHNEKGQEVLTWKFKPVK